MITSGKNHTLLGMEIYLLDDNNLENGMKSNTPDAINFLNQGVSTKVSSPASKNIQEVNTDPLTLPENQIEDFHSMVVKLIWTTK